MNTLITFFIFLYFFLLSPLVTLPISASGMSRDAATLGQLNDVIENIVNALIPFAAIVSIIMIVVGGFQYFTAGGDKEGSARAQRTLTYAFGGLLLTISAWMIISLVGNFLGIPVGEFNICFPGSSGPNCT